MLGGGSSAAGGNENQQTCEWGPVYTPDTELPEIGEGQSRNPVCLSVRPPPSPLPAKLGSQQGP